MAKRLSLNNDELTKTNLKWVLVIKYSVEHSSKIGRGVKWPDFTLQTCQFCFWNKMVLTASMSLMAHWTFYYHSFCILQKVK